MKEEILKKLEELLQICNEAKVPAMFVAEIGDESIKGANVEDQRLAKLLLIQLDGNDELQNHFLQNLEAVAGETNTSEDAEASQNPTTD